MQLVDNRAHVAAFPHKGGPGTRALLYGIER